MTKPQKAWVNRGAVLGMMQRHEEAFESFDQAVQLETQRRINLASTGGLAPGKY